MLHPIVAGRIGLQESLMIKGFDTTVKLVEGLQQCREELLLSSESRRVS